MMNICLYDGERMYGSLDRLIDMDRGGHETRERRRWMEQRERAWIK